MPKKLIKKYSPEPEKIRNMKGLGFLAKWLGSSNLWHIHRRNTAKSFAIGLFWMSIPIPSQMVMAAISSILLRANLPVSVALVWISNPFTMAPIFYFNYFIGTIILGYNAQESLGFEMSWNWLLNTLGELWMPLFLGSFLVGMILSITSYFGLLFIWRANVLSKFKSRKQLKETFTQD